MIKHNLKTPWQDFGLVLRYEGGLKISFMCILLGFSQNFGQSLL